MLKYKFKIYYPNYVNKNSLYKIRDNIYMDYLYKEKTFGKQYLEFNLTHCINDFNVGYGLSGNFERLISLLNRKKGLILNNIELSSCYTNYILTALTNAMFLREIQKDENLLKTGICISNGEKSFNFNIPLAATKNHDFFSYGEIIHGKHGDSSLVSNILYNRGICAKNLYILIDKGKFKLDDYEHLIFLYLKCALICSKKAYEYGNLLGCLLNKTSCLECSYRYINSVKRLGLFDISELKSSNLNIYSKSKTSENVYLSINHGVFISNFNTYSNLKSFDETDTIIATIEEYYEDKIMKDKIVLSSSILNYFSFLKKNRKEPLYSNDYNKLNKILNAIKSISEMKEMKIEFSDIEKNIHNIELSIDNDNIEQILEPRKFDLIPKNINQALELKEFFTTIADSVEYCDNTFDIYAFSSDSIFHPLSGKTKKQLEEPVI